MADVPEKHFERLGRRADGVFQLIEIAAYLLLGESQYTYTPVGLANLLGAMTISGQIFMIPRQTTQISIIWGS